MIVVFMLSMICVSFVYVCENLYQRRATAVVLYILYAQFLLGLTTSNAEMCISLY